MLDTARMAAKHEIQIDVDRDGNVSFLVKAVKGTKCLEIAEDIENALGIIRVEEDPRTGDRDDEGPAPVPARLRPRPQGPSGAGAVPPPPHDG
jgi:hypothetical protein